MQSDYSLRKQEVLSQNNYTKLLQYINITVKPQIRQQTHWTCYNYIYFYFYFPQYGLNQWKWYIFPIFVFIYHLFYSLLLTHAFTWHYNAVRSQQSMHSYKLINIYTIILLHTTHFSSWIVHYPLWDKLPHAIRLFTQEAGSSFIEQPEKAFIICTLAWQYIVYKLTGIHINHRTFKCWNFTTLCSVITCNDIIYAL